MKRKMFAVVLGLSAFVTGAICQKYCTAAELAPPTWPKGGGRFRRCLGNSALAHSIGRLQLEKSATKTDF